MRKAALLSIAGTTFREAMRSRVFYALLLFSILLILLSAVLSELTLGWEVRIVADLSLTTCSLFAVTMALLLSISSISRELERRTALPVLAKPITRWHFIGGKYLGVLAVVTANLFLMACAATLMIRAHSNSSFEYPLGDYLQVLAFIWLKAAVVTAFSTFFAAIASSTVAFIAASGMVMAGHLSAGMQEFLSKSEVLELRLVGSSLYYTIPDLGALSGLPQLVNHTHLDSTHLTNASVYSFCYIAIVLFLTTFIFARRDLG